MHAQLIVNTLNTASVITFDADVSGVFRRTSVTTTGWGTTTNATTPIDSDAWAGRAGLASANLTLPAAATGSSTAVGFGGSLGAGSLSRGLSATGNFGTAGVGLATGTPTDWALGFAPSGIGADFATIFLRVQNTTGSTVSSWNISYLGYYIDLNAYSTPVTFAYSTDGGANFSSNIPALGFTTPGTGTVTTPVVGDWTSVAGLSSSLSATVANNDYLILRWGLGADIAVNGTRGNIVALDNISVTAVPEPATWALLGVGLSAFTIFRRRSRAG